MTRRWPAGKVHNVRRQETAASRTQPREQDPINPADQASQVTPISGEGFEQVYNDQAAVRPGCAAGQMGSGRERPDGQWLFDAATVNAYVEWEIELWIALGRDAHHLFLDERFSPDAPGSTQRLRWSRQHGA